MYTRSVTIISTTILSMAYVIYITSDCTVIPATSFTADVTHEGGQLSYYTYMLSSHVSFHDHGDLYTAKQVGNVIVDFS